MDLKREGTLRKIFLLGLVFCTCLVKASDTNIDYSQKRHQLLQVYDDLKLKFGDDYECSLSRNQILNAKNADLIRIEKEVILANPYLKAPVYFVKRHQYAKDHHNSETIFHTNEINTGSYRKGGTLSRLVIRNGQVESSDVLTSNDGVYRDIEVNYEASKIVYSKRNNIDEDYKVYEMNLTDHSFKQLTFAKGVTDVDPNYLPNGQIMFTSTREPKYCMCNVHIMGNIFKMDHDGANITQLGKSTLWEGHPIVMPDGKILYDRWEYVDRNFGDAQGLWTMNPDGTNQAIYFGNNTSSPGGFIDARPIPGTDKVIAVLGSCHDRPWGALGIIDHKKGIDGEQAVDRTWPAWAKNEMGKGNWDHFMRIRPLYEDPYPLDDTYFLCSRQVDPKNEKMGLFIIDMFGNETLIYESEDNFGAFNPVPINARNKEHQLKEKRNYASKTGSFYIQNVYEGTHVKGVEKGSVKYLRIIESLEKRSWTVPAWQGQGVHRPAMNWHSFEAKRILGTVPVEDDGSVFFEVPADTYVFFQLLDQDKKMIQTMRSGTMVKPGEVLGCVGCHDDRRMTPTLGYSPMALQKEPQQMNGWFGEARKFGFMEEVQPVFTKNCVSCHDFGKKAGDILNLAPDRNMYFNAAYIDLYVKKKMQVIGAGPAALQEAYTWGANMSDFIKIIENGHHGVELSKEEMERLTTWVDLNGVYYKDFISAFPNNPVGRSPITEEETQRLQALTGVPFNKLGGFYRTLGPQISFDRPELSPCLKSLKKNSKKYKEALAIIYKGQERLNENPRLDMPGFEASTKDKERLQKYVFRLSEETKNREAITKGEKRFDK
jgi:hypothetical protein